MAAHKQQLDATLHAFISSSAAVLGGGEFPKLEESAASAAATKSTGKNDDDDDDDEEEEENENENDEDDDEEEELANSPRIVKAPKLNNSDSSGMMRTACQALAFTTHDNKRFYAT